MPFQCVYCGYIEANEQSIILHVYIFHKSGGESLYFCDSIQDEPFVSKDFTWEGIKRQRLKRLHKKFHPKRTCKLHCLVKLGVDYLSYPKKSLPPLKIIPQAEGESSSSLENLQCWKGVLIKVQS